MPNTHPPSRQRIELFFQAKRLIQIFWACEITLAVLLAQRLLLNSFELSFIIFTTMCALSLVYLLAKRDKVNHASNLLLAILALILVALMWMHGGVHDEAVFGFPSLLIMAAMFGNKKSFIVLLTIFGLSIAANAVSNHLGWVTNYSPKVDLTSGFLFIFMLLLISYSIWVAAMDYRLLLDKLHKENTEVINSKKEIEEMLLHDILTGLPNRAMAEIVLTNALKKAARTHQKNYLMFIDLDNFKLINDALGHQAGDALLVEISTRLQTLLRKNDTVCRFAGDEFIIIFDTIDSQELMATISEKIIDIIKTPFYFNSNEFICGCSIGITVSPDDGSDFETLLRNADTAMYFSKANGGNNFHFFDQKMDNQGHDYLNLINDLRQAIKKQEFFLTYQPKVDLTNKKIIGAEALIRWQHPKKGVIYPDQFIPEAEKSGLINEIGEWVIKQACLACKDWITAGFKDFTVAVNVSSQQFKQDNIYQVVKTALNNAKLAGKHLELEMTESLLVENSHELKKLLQDISLLGVHLSIDDFGTGYSNLSYLKEFDIKTLKIDRSFVNDVENNGKNKALVKAIIQMAKGLELTTVGEGVENQQVAELLSDFTCDYGQGYLWSKPVRDKDFIKFIHSYAKPS
ncbi:EAL domain-containing protein [Paraglaciecola aquimarina]|uniref:EAL domain-containing protein n=1 Tax=Paraglaciecola algarum TaxID=3050085 RepID=A0ABS9DDT5_9ALTE|nr:EAL domain-containing protein [Paraglaciecola sp. G1-23]MCF2949781.1 EAL domain-containing protein [Paraglaciecola sp. G1-23]